MLDVRCQRKCRSKDNSTCVAAYLELSLIELRNIIETSCLATEEEGGGKLEFLFWICLV